MERHKALIVTLLFAGLGGCGSSSITAPDTPKPDRDLIEDIEIIEVSPVATATYGTTCTATIMVRTKP